MSVRTHPGARMKATTPSLPKPRAMERVSATMPPFEAAYAM